MTYELECGHCGYRFTLADSVLPRSAKCVVCGAVLTIAVPVPIVSEAPPEPLPSFPPPPPPEAAEPLHPPISPPLPEPKPEPSFPPFTPGRPDLDDLVPGERARHLVPPWPAVRAGLNTARFAANLGQCLYAIALAWCLILIQFTPPVESKGPRRAEAFLASTGASLVLPILVHVVGQFYCAFVPHSYGGRLAATSLVLLLLSVGAGGLFETSVLLGIGAVAAFVVISFAVWLTFLARLGQRLDDREMAAEVWSFNSWCWAGFVVSFGLLGVAGLGERIGGGALIWFFRAVAGVIGFRLLHGYSALLRTATLTVERRAPVSPRCP